MDQRKVATIKIDEFLVVWNFFSRDEGNGKITWFHIGISVIKKSKKGGGGGMDVYRFLEMRHENIKGYQSTCNQQQSHRWTIIIS